jgi:deazaflavin-dependent oxidoreductase (nitroreductase family)
MSSRMLKAQNKIVGFLVGTLGLNLQGAEVLEVRGRKSGEIRALVVNPLELGGTTYLMSARGESPWVENIRASGEGTLRRGRHRRSFHVQELTNEDEKLPVVRAYLQKWGWQVKSFMGVDGHSTDDELRAILPKHPVFRVLPDTSPRNA